jgi:histidinol-phosphate phosphatase family protein
MAKIEKIKQAVILAGGMGLRLRPLTYDRPKLVVRVNNRPFLDYLLELLKKNGVSEVIVLLGYLPEKITEYLGDGSKFGIKVKYSIGAIDDGTGTRVKNAKDLLDDTFLLLYCDNYLRLDLQELLRFHNEKEALVTMTVYTNKYGFTKNNVFVDGGYVNKYDRSRKDPGLNGVDLGFFIMNKKALDLIPQENSYIDEKLIPALIAKGGLAGYTTDRLYYSLSTPERLKMTENFLKPRKVIFLDRDGVINKKMPMGDYVRNWDEFEFLPGAIEAMRVLTENGYEIYVISNQAGIGRGLMTEGDLFEIHKSMEAELAKRGAKIAAIYYCPHGWNDGCLCRKPKPGMLFRAAIDHQIDLPNTIFVGDDERDGEAGRAAGCRTILLKENDSLLSAVRSIIS